MYCNFTSTSTNIFNFCSVSFLLIFFPFQRKFNLRSTLFLVRSWSHQRGAGFGRETMTVSLFLYSGEHFPLLSSFGSFLAFRFVAVRNLTMCWWWNGRNELGHKKLDLHAVRILHCLERLGWYCFFSWHFLFLESWFFDYCIPGTGIDTRYSTWYQYLVPVLFYYDVQSTIDTGITTLTLYSYPYLCNTFMYSTRARVGGVLPVVLSISILQVLLCTRYR
jgi:hypothetical protein